MPPVESDEKTTTAEQPKTGAAPPPDSALPATRPAGAVGVQRMGMTPNSFEEGWRLAQILAKSSLVPESFREKPGDVLVAIQLGMEVGFAPMQALQSICVINGRPTIWGDGFLALIVSSAVYRAHEEYYEVDGERRTGLVSEDWKKDDSAAVCTFWRKDTANPISRRFNVGQAKKAGLLTKKGPWQDYPDRMLALRARSFAGRDGFSDVLRGMKTTEEALDTENAIDIQPLASEPIQPRRASEARASSASTPPLRKADTPATPDAPSEPATASSSPAPATAAASNGAPGEGPKQIRGLKVTDTKFVKPKTGEPYYEVTTKTTTGRDVVFLTRDEQVYKEATSFEGTDHLVVAGYKEATKEQAKVFVLESLAIYEGGGSSDSANGGLFS